jgi:CheY-like chemotaxis protein
MFKCQDDQLAVLGLCVEEPMMVGRVAGLNYHSVNSGRRAIDMLRMLSFDLVLVGMRVPDVSAWDVVRRIRTAWPWQKWALVAPRLTEQQEITARMFGSIKIYEAMPSSDELFELTSRLRQRAATAVLHSQFTQPTLPSRAAVAQ